MPTPELYARASLMVDGARIPLRAVAEALGLPVAKTAQLVALGRLRAAEGDSAGELTVLSKGCGPHLAGMVTGDPGTMLHVLGCDPCQQLEEAMAVGIRRARRRWTAGADAAGAPAPAPASTPQPPPAVAPQPPPAVAPQPPPAVPPPPGAVARAATPPPPPPPPDSPWSPPSGSSWSPPSGAPAAGSPPPTAAVDVASSVEAEVEGDATGPLPPVPAHPTPAEVVIDLTPPDLTEPMEPVLTDPVPLGWSPVVVTVVPPAPPRRRRLLRTVLGGAAISAVFVAGMALPSFSAESLINATEELLARDVSADAAPAAAGPAGRAGPPQDVRVPATWDWLAVCESSGNWAADTGNGYYGGLQFRLSSWEMVGGEGMPHEASRDQQISRAIALWQVQGWQAWPVCSRRLGYR